MKNCSTFLEKLGHTGVIGDGIFVATERSSHCQHQLQVSNTHTAVLQERVGGAREHSVAVAIAMEFFPSLLWV